MSITQYLLFISLLINMLIAEDIPVPHHTIQQQQILDTPSSSLSEQMVNLLNSPITETALVEEDNLDVNYLSNLIPYYQGAMNASEFILKHSKNQKIHNIAQDIIDIGREQIASYNSLLPQLKEQKKLYSPKETTLFNNQAKIDIQSLHNAMNEVNLSKNLDYDFLAIMIPLYQAIITSSKHIMQYTQNEDIKTLAQDIVLVQEKEIEKLQVFINLLPQP